MWELGGFLILVATNLHEVQVVVFLVAAVISFMLCIMSRANQTSTAGHSFLSLERDIIHEAVRFDG
jgi:hypothetical protein